MVSCRAIVQFPCEKLWKEVDYLQCSLIFLYFDRLSLVLLYSHHFWLHFGSSRLPCEAFGTPWGSMGAPGSSIGSHLGPLETPLGPIWDFMRPPWDHLRLPWDPFGTHLGSLRVLMDPACKIVSFWRHFGSQNGPKMSPKWVIFSWFF